MNRSRCVLDGGYVSSLASGGFGKKLLGWTLLSLGVLAANVVPDWVFSQ